MKEKTSPNDTIDLTFINQNMKKYFLYLKYSLTKYLHSTNMKTLSKWQINETNKRTLN